MTGDAKGLARKGGERAFQNDWLIWEKFVEIMDGNRVTNYVRDVSHANKAYSYLGPAAGTLCLLKHNCTQGTAAMLSYVGVAAMEAMTNDTYLRRAVRLIAKDIWRFRVVVGTGSMNTAQTLIAISAKFDMLTLLMTYIIHIT